jgi:hypothetical protein
MAIGHLAARYFTFFVEDDVRTLVLHNPFGGDTDYDTGAFTAPDPAASVQALELVNGTWTREDLTDRPLRVWCRDDDADRIDKLVIVVGNSSTDAGHTLTPTPEPLLLGSNLGCKRWVGTVTGKARDKRGARDVTESWTAHDLVFSQAPGVPYKNVFNLTQGTLDWQVSGTIDETGCTESGSKSYDLAAVGIGQLNLATPFRRPPNDRAYAAGGAYHPGTVDATVTCPPPLPGTTTFTVEPDGEWVNMGTDNRAKDDGTLSGSFSRTAFGYLQLSWTWDLRSER